MRLLRPQIHKAVRQAGALLLVLWMGGFACLTSCAGSVLADSSDSCDLSIKSAKKQAEECHLQESKPIQKASSCCKLPEKSPKQQNNECKIDKIQKTAGSKLSRSVSTAPQIFQTTGLALPQQNSSPAPCRMKCCPLNRDLSEPARSGSYNFHSDGKSLEKTEPILNSERISFSFSLPQQTRDRGDTYLRCCIFLI
jgi:hypothetical protein